MMLGKERRVLHLSVTHAHLVHRSLPFFPHVKKELDKDEEPKSNRAHNLRNGSPMG